MPAQVAEPQRERPALDGVEEWRATGIEIAEPFSDREREDCVEHRLESCRAVDSADESSCRL